MIYDVLFLQDGYYLEPDTEKEISLWYVALCLLTRLVRWEVGVDSEGSLHGSVGHDLSLDLLYSIHSIGRLRCNRGGSQGQGHFSKGS